MAKLKNKGAAVHLYRPAGHPDSMLVEHNQVVDVPGTAKVGEDAILVTKNEQVTSFPRSRWEHVVIEQAKSGEGDQPSSKEN